MNAIPGTYPGSFLVATLGWSILLHSLFVMRVTSLEFLPSPQLCFLRFRAVFRVNVLAAFGWSIGVALFPAQMIRYGAQVPQLVFLGLIGSVGVVAYLPPTVCVHRRLAELGRERAELLASTTRAKLEEALAHGAGWQDVFTFEGHLGPDVSAALSSTMGLRYVAVLLTSFVIPVLVNIVTSALAKWSGISPK
jgi:hypothetical protein